MPSSTFASALAPEILELIFFLRITADTAHPGPKGTAHGRSLLSVTHVCQNWRRTAIGSKRLWRVPSTFDWQASPEWIDEFLHRSNPLPISLCIPQEATLSTPQTLFRALRHLERAEYVELKLTQGIWEELLDSHLLAVPALRLRQLEVATVDQDGAAPRSLSRVLQWPSDIFARVSPRLQSVSIRGKFAIATLGDPSLWGCLTRLAISEVQDIAVPELIQALRRMPLLETLELDLNHRNIDTKPTNPALISEEDMVTLYHLRVCNITANVGTSAYIVQRLRLPPHCSMQYHCSGISRQNLNQLRMTTVYFCPRFSRWTFVSPSGLPHVKQIIDINRHCMKVAYVVPAGVKEVARFQGHPSYLGMCAEWKPSGMDSLEGQGGAQASTSYFARSFKSFMKTCGRSPAPPRHLEIKLVDGLRKCFRPLLFEWIVRDCRRVATLHIVDQRAWSCLKRVFKPHDLNDLETTFDAGPPTRSIRGEFSPTSIIAFPEVADLILQSIDFEEENGRHWRRLLNFLDFRRVCSKPITRLTFKSCVGVQAKTQDLYAINGLQWVTVDEQCWAPAPELYMNPEEQELGYDSSGWISD